MPKIDRINLGLPTSEHQSMPTAAIDRFVA